MARTPSVPSDDQATVAIVFYTASTSSGQRHEPDHRPKLAEQNSSPFSVCKDLDHSDAQTGQHPIKANSFESSSCLDCFNNCFAFGAGSLNQNHRQPSPATVTACWCVTELRRYSTISQDTTPRLRKESSGIKSSRNEWDMGMASKNIVLVHPRSSSLTHCSDGDSNWILLTPD